MECKDLDLCCSFLGFPLNVWQLHAPTLNSGHDHEHSANYGRIHGLVFDLRETN